jgi:uncharacterized membrane protein YuzA (DUF378 family)
MSKRQIIMILGALVIIIALPILGFPSAWDNIAYIIIGIIIIAVAYLMEPVRSVAKPAAPYVEHFSATATTPAEAGSLSRSETSSDIQQ